MFPLGMVTELDRASLAGYCVSWARWVEAELRVNQFGSILISSDGGMYQSPYLAVANRAMADMQRFGSLFGFDPSSRTRLHANPPEKNKKPEGKARFFSCN